MEVINGTCTPKCPTGYRRNENGTNCVPIENCNTDDEIINALQAIFDELWASSNASNTSVPMNQRMENGGWIVNGPRGYSFVPFGSGTTSTPCGIDGDVVVPDNLVGMIHSHPFYVGEDRRSVCTDKGVEEGYLGGPSDADHETLIAIMNMTGNFGLKGYVIDGNFVSSYDWSGASNIKTFSRCGY